MMKCPYCISEIDSKALVCKICKRDLFLPKQMMARISHLEQQLKSTLSDKTSNPKSDEPCTSAESIVPMLSFSQKCSIAAIDFTIFFIAPFILLLLAHLCVSIVYDTKILYLRLVTLILPMFFGIFLCRNQSRNIAVWFFWAIVLGLIAVIAMSAMTSLVDDSPILPQSMYEWRDMIEFAASISFSYLTGMYLGKLIFLRTTNLMPLTSSKHSDSLWMTQSDEQKSTQASLQLMAKKTNELFTTIGAITTTIIAIYTGTKSLF